MSNQLIEVAKNVAAVAGNDAENKSQAEAELALAISRTLSVPLAIDEGMTAKNYFHQKFGENVSILLCKVNELQVIDIDCALKCVENLYETAFNIIHAPAEASDVFEGTVRKVYSSETMNLNMDNVKTLFHKLNNQ